MEDRPHWQVGVLFIAILVVAAGFSAARDGEAGAAIPTLSHCERIQSLARTGDVLFRAESGFVSRMVMRVQGDDRYSHVGIVVADGRGVRVHHAEIDGESGADGVIAQDVCAYLKRAERAALMRLHGLSEPERAEVVRQVAAIGHRPFNRRLQWEPDDGSVYCTQYVWLILERAWPSGMGAKRSRDLLTVPALLDSLPLTLVSAVGG